MARAPVNRALMIGTGRSALVLYNIWVNVFLLLFHLHHRDRFCWWCLLPSIFPPEETFSRSRFEYANESAISILMKRNKQNNNDDDGTYKTDKGKRDILQGATVHFICPSFRGDKGADEMRFQPN